MTAARTVNGESAPRDDRELDPGLGHSIGRRGSVQETTVDIRFQVVVFDAADIAAVSSFWAGVVGGTVDAEDDWHMVMDPDGVPRIGVQLAPDHVPPGWPGGTPQQQVHLDLWVADLAASHDEVMGLGAVLLQAAPDLDAEEGFQVYADPAGHPFCLCWHRTALG